MPLRRLDRAEIAYLLMRGARTRGCRRTGTARLVLQRAAEAGDADATFALGITYDPILLKTRRVIGVAPDTGSA